MDKFFKSTLALFSLLVVTPAAYISPLLLAIHLTREKPDPNIPAWSRQKQEPGITQYIAMLASMALIVLLHIKVFLKYAHVPIFKNLPTWYYRFIPSGFLNLGMLKAIRTDVEANKMDWNKYKAAFAKLIYKKNGETVTSYEYNFSQGGFKAKMAAESKAQEELRQELNFITSNRHIIEEFSQELSEQFAPFYTYGVTCTGQQAFGAGADIRQTSANDGLRRR